MSSVGSGLGAKSCTGRLCLELQTLTIFDIKGITLAYSFLRKWGSLSHTHSTNSTSLQRILVQTNIGVYAIIKP